MKTLEHNRFRIQSNGTSPGTWKLLRINKLCCLARIQIIYEHIEQTINTYASPYGVGMPLIGLRGPTNHLNRERLKMEAYSPKAVPL